MTPAETPIASLADVVMRVIENIPAFVLLYMMWKERDRDYRQEKDEHDALQRDYMLFLKQRTIKGDSQEETD